MWLISIGYIWKLSWIRAEILRDIMSFLLDMSIIWVHPHNAAMYTIILTSATAWQVQAQCVYSSQVFNWVLISCNKWVWEEWVGDTRMAFSFITTGPDLMIAQFRTQFYSLSVFQKKWVTMVKEGKSPANYLTFCYIPWHIIFLERKIVSNCKMGFPSLPAFSSV